ncbi:thioredoxin-dependent thiol peroxidase [Algoriphagus halophytocola]|uniref:thioredoxin-dependent peroxiredoxin n=1 Tax=Algoriphagus halophytocola TaxID=2991499 RepID=A0ABY6MJR5_9BACT|nr:MULTISPECIES: thioredoxin-dependent thiol peroxidase [unclassified Algoriphagus]UZD23305.1 thioredoxin-dependent thiol peroxidase [Algoriphagus sp. TR-M5]WBL44599.1 thioredoxin-dependent thiol peroxidase [Algoriphagus sp. TR-M9]
MTLKVGELAPDFEAKIETGETIKLADYRGKKVVLYFYPKDNTPGCTAESCNLRDNYDALIKAGYVVLGVSSDSEKSHQRFIEKQNLPFSLIADTDLKVHEAFGTWQEKKNFGKTYMGTVRTTFIIDEEGKIEEIISKVNTKEHTSQILK